MDRSDVLPLCPFENDRKKFCYANACLQCVLSYEPLNARLRSSTEHSPLSSLAKQYFNRVPYNLSSKDVRLGLGDPFHQPQQQDAAEFFVKLTEKYPILQDTFTFTEVAKKRCVAPNCSYSSENSEQSNSLELHVCRNNVNIDDLIQDYQSEGSIDDDCTCEKCKAKGTYLHKLCVENPSELLAIELKIFSDYSYDPHGRYVAQKNKNRKFNDIPSRDIFIGGCRYTLHAAIFHIGSTVNSGHYIACVKENDILHHANDDSVQQIRLNEWPKPGTDPYMLFYKKTDVLLEVECLKSSKKVDDETHQPIQMSVHSESKRKEKISFPIQKSFLQNQSTQKKSFKNQGLDSHGVNTIGLDVKMANREHATSLVRLNRDASDAKTQKSAVSNFFSKKRVGSKAQECKMKEEISSNVTGEKFTLFHESLIPPSNAEKRPMSDSVFMKTGQTLTAAAKQNYCQTKSKTKEFHEPKANTVRPVQKMSEQFRTESTSQGLRCPDNFQSMASESKQRRSHKEQRLDFLEVKLGAPDAKIQENGEAPAFLAGKKGLDANTETQKCEPSTVLAKKRPALKAQRNVKGEIVSDSVKKKCVLSHGSLASSSVVNDIFCNSSETVLKKKGQISPTKKTYQEPESEVKQLHEPKSIAIHPIPKMLEQASLRPAPVERECQSNVRPAASQKISSMITEEKADADSQEVLVSSFVAYEKARMKNRSCGSTDNISFGTLNKKLSKAQRRKLYDKLRKSKVSVSEQVFHDKMCVEPDSHVRKCLCDKTLSVRVSADQNERGSGVSECPVDVSDELPHPTSELYVNVEEPSCLKPQDKRSVEGSMNATKQEASKPKRPIGMVHEPCDYLQDLEFRTIHGNRNVNDSWQFFTAIVDALERRKKNQEDKNKNTMTVGVKIRTDLFLFTNLETWDVFHAPGETMCPVDEDCSFDPPCCYEILVPEESVRLHVVIEMDKSQDKEGMFVQKITDYLQSVIIHLLKIKFQKDSSASDYAVLRLESKNLKNVVVRIMNPNIVFMNLASLLHFVALVNCHVEETSENDVNAYFLSRERSAVHVRIVTPCLYSFDEKRRKQSLAPNDGRVGFDTYEDYLLAPPSIQEEENKLNYSSGYSLAGLIEGDSLKDEIIYAVHSTKGSVYNRAHLPNTILLWFLSKLGPKNLLEIIIYQFEKKVNLYFENLRCKYRTDGVTEHNMYIQVCGSSYVGYYMCEENDCAGREHYAEYRNLLKMINFIVPSHYYQELDQFFDNDQLKQVGYTVDETAKSKEFIREEPCMALMKYDANFVKRSFELYAYKVRDIKKKELEMQKVKENYEKRAKSKHSNSSCELINPVVRNVGEPLIKPPENVVNNELSDSRTETVSGESLHKTPPSFENTDGDKKLTSHANIGEDPLSKPLASSTPKKEVGSPSEKSNAAEMLFECRMNAEQNSEKSFVISGSSAEDLSIPKVVSSTRLDNKHSAESATASPNNASEVKENLFSTDSPPKTQERKTQKRTVYKCQTPGRFKYSNVVGSFHVSEKQWKQMWDPKRQNLKRKKYGYTLSEAFNQLRVFCVLNMEKHRKQKAAGEEWPLITVYGVCAFRDCKHYKLLVDTRPSENGSRKVCVTSCACERNHVGYLTRVLNAHGRVKAKKVLRHINPSKYLTQVKIAADEEFIENGNLLDIKTAQVITKVRQEEMAKNDRHYHALIDVILKREENIKKKLPNPILYARAPFQVALIDEKRLEMFKWAHTDEINFDATGNTCAAVNKEDPQILYYTAAFKTASGKVAPLAELISTQHNAVTIGNFLREVTYYAQGSKRGLLVRHVVTDMSFALINAVNDAMNERKGVLEYLKTCYTLVTSSDDWRKQKNIKMCFIHMCVAHFIKNFVSIVKRMYLSPPLDETGKEMSKAKFVSFKRFVVEAMCLPIRMHDYEAVKDVFKSLLTLLVVEEETPSVVEAKRKLQACADKLAVELKETIYKEQDKSNLETSNSCTDPYGGGVPLKTRKADYKECPFYKDIKKIFDGLVPKKKTAMVADSRKMSEDKPGQPTEGTEPIINEETSNGKQDGPDVNLVSDVPPQHIGEEMPIQQNEEPAPVTHKNIEEKRKPNNYFNMKLAHFILKHFAHILPLWTGLCSPIGRTFSNALVENWFNLVKTILLDGRKRWRGNRYVDEIQTHVDGLYVDEKHCIPQKRLAQGRKRKAPEDSGPKNTSKRRGNAMRYASTEMDSSQQDNTMDVEEPATSDDSHCTEYLSGKNVSRISDISFETADKAYDHEAEECWGKKSKEPYPGYMAAYNVRTLFKGPDVKKPSRKHLSTIAEESMVRSNEQQNEIQGNLQSDRMQVTEEGVHLTVEDGLMEPALESENNQNTNELSNQASLPNNKISSLVNSRDESESDIFPDDPFGRHMSRSRLESGVIHDEKYYGLIQSWFSAKTSLSYVIMELPLGFEAHKRSSWRFSWDDFKRLYDDTALKLPSRTFWLGSLSIDSTVEILMKMYKIDKSTVVIANSNIYRSIMKDEQIDKSFQLSESAQWVMFFESKFDTHWCILLFDLKEHCFYYLDPLGMKERCGQFSKIARFLGRFFPSKNFQLWNQRYVEYPVQWDSFNCGVHVIYFTQNLLHNFPKVSIDIVPEGEFNPSQYRLVLRNLLLRNSLDMKNYCLSCGQKWGGRIKLGMVQCLYCKRWAHISPKCTELSEDDYQKLKECKDSKFICRCCKSNIKIFNEEQASRKQLLRRTLEKKYFGKLTQDKLLDDSIRCPACIARNFPGGAHKCDMCGISVHLLPECSRPIGTEEDEGYGQKALCMKCHRKTFSQ